jgi:hypothetical protein
MQCVGDECRGTATRLDAVAQLASMLVDADDERVVHDTLAEAGAQPHELICSQRQLIDANG